MKSPKSTGRIIGVLLLAQMAAGLTVPFMILRPRLIGYPEFLTAAAANASLVRSAVAIAFVGSALTVTLGVMMLPVLRRYSEGTAFWFLSICMISAVLDAVQNASVMAMLSLSQEYVKAAGANQAVYEIAGASAAATRRWIHVAQLVGFDAWIFVFHSSLFRFRLIPRPLAALGAVGILLPFIGVTLMMFLGANVISAMALPMGPIQLAIAGWLIVKGFRKTQEGATA